MSISYLDYPYNENMGRFKAIGRGEVEEISKKIRQAILILQDQLGDEFPLTAEMIHQVAQKL